MRSLQEAIAWRYPKYAKRLCDIFSQANDCPAQWQNITRLSLTQFVAHLNMAMSKNSARTYAAMFKATLNLYSEEVELPSGYDKILSLKSGGVAPTWLTEAEVQQLIDYVPQGETEAVVVSQFILGCLTGARHSDYRRFDTTNISGNSLVYVSQKTNIRTEVPLSPAVERILGSGLDINVELQDSTFNRTLRLACMRAGINARTRVFHAGQEQVGEKWEFVASHTARRSFATNVYLRCRDIFLVSKYMGHTSVDMTAKYILSIGDAPEEVREYFKKFL